MRLQASAPGKVNLGLLLGPARADGRHELVTVFQSVSLADELTLTVGGEADGVRCPGVQGENLALAALRGLRARGWRAPPVQVEIVKRIPVAAGMGGGSADAAAVLRLACELAAPAAGVPEAVAAELGADVPAQLQPGAALGTGAGEQVQALAPLPPHAYVILPQPSPLPTAEVYREADRLGLGRAMTELAAARRGLPESLRAGTLPAPGCLTNDLEAATLSLRPGLRAALEAVREAGADRALVCGSGPTVAGIFWGPGSAARAQLAAAGLQRSSPAVAALPVDAAFAAPRRLSSSG